MKRIVYIILISALIVFTLKGCLKKDLGYDSDVYLGDVRPLEVIKYDFEKPKNITINNVDYLQARGEVGKFGGEIITSTIGEGPKTFNPFNANDNTSAQLAGIMYDGLFTTDPYDGSIIPKLAKSIEILPNKKTYIVHLRHGIKWSDNKEITADDVVFTYKTIIFGGFGDTATRDSLYIEGKLPSVEKIDKYTVKFTTPKPFAPFLRMLTTPIAPKHVFKIATDKGKSYFRSYLSTNAKPEDFVTSGAFKISEYVPAQRVIYKRNPNYYMVDKKGQKLPYLDKYIILIVGDLNNDTLKFEGLETDVVNLQGSMVARYRELEKHSDFTLYNLGPTTNTTFIVFNMNTRKNKEGKYYVSPVKQRWFGDVNFRSAVDWAIDRENLVLNVLSGVGEPLYSAESISSIFLNEEIAKGHGQDITYAKELLKKSGFYLKDGKLYDKFGNRVEFELLTNAGNTQREATGVSIKEDLQQLGMKVNFKPVEFNSLVAKLSNTYDWDAILIALTGNPLEPHSGHNVWTSDGALHLFNQRSDEDLKSSDKILPFEKELDRIFKQAALELDYKKRKELYDRYQQIVAEQNPVIYLYSPANIVAIRKKFKNIYPTELGGILHNIEEVYID
ncbi:TPA: ABC transporter substrate-binding protein [Candidatus Galligastranaerophilus intestinavium]|uniref:ABC transporter substrate-binding protein n=1 Tax=Candidatus Galligastranaerophilus intestinavium TaxID=2840836 RepID=A0A9D1JYP9_9BACT|nr:ABC transporter substrate-binding protein [Candidatus Galligastranaerophilus intestinavium]